VSGVPAELATTLAPSEADRLLQAEALVRSYCGWHIAPSRTDEVAVLPATFGQVALLPSLHVTAVTSITEDGVTVDDSLYTWAPNGVLTRSWGWNASVTVTFTHGYEEVPAEVTAVVQAVAQRAVDNPSSLVRVQKGPFADTYSQTGFNQSLPIALLDAEKEILDRYRIPPRP
jgi:hypothetical protein